MCSSGSTGPIYLLIEITFIILFIVAIVFSFYLVSDINKIDEIKIKTNFDIMTNNNKSNWLINYIEDFKENDTNIIEEFFNKYNLKEGQTFNDNEDIMNCFNKLYRINLAIAIILIIIILFGFIFAICSFNCLDGRDGGELDLCLSWVIIQEIFRIITFIILLGIFIGFFISYKNTFENEFFDLYNNISNDIERTSFKEYYYALFDLKNHFLVDLVLMSLSVLKCIIIIIGAIFVCRSIQD